MGQDMTHDIDKHCDEDGGRHLGGVGRVDVLSASDELVVFAPVQQADDAEDDDGEYRDDRAAGKRFASARRRYHRATGRLSRTGRRARGELRTIELGKHTIAMLAWH
jgi:hypothetical protein